jgi:hypothetical protein
VTVFCLYDLNNRFRQILDGLAQEERTGRNHAGTRPHWHDNSIAPLTRRCRNGGRAEVLQTMRAQVTGMQPMQAEDVADAITYIVTRPRHIAINEMQIRPTEQE